MPIKSPWLEQLRRTRPKDVLTKNIAVDVAVVGGGIAGLSTAYFLLKDTQKSVALIEAGMVAHGATGHNAGQVVAGFERPFRELVTQFGLEEAGKAVAAIEGTWQLLEEMMERAQLQTPVSFCSGYLGYTTKQQVMDLVENASWREKAKLAPEPLLIAEEEGLIEAIPHVYHHLFSKVPRKDIISLLETSDKEYVAAQIGRRACMNSARFTEELAGFLLHTYPERFSLFEDTPVDTVDLAARQAVLETKGGHTIKAKRVVLCTNGFEYIHIRNHGVDIDTKFHHSVQGTVGYMVGYLDPIDRPPTANAYFEKENQLKPFEPYFYLTRRPFELEDKLTHNLVCAGGPEFDLEDLAGYDSRHEMPETALKDLDAFLKRGYAFAPQDKIEYRYQWHGLMGYTPNRIRLVGAEPCNPTLMYNLGCNGIGIIPSIFGGHRIAQIIGGKKVKPLIFDPRDMRCMIA